MNYIKINELQLFRGSLLSHVEGEGLDQFKEKLEFHLKQFLAFLIRFWGEKRNTSMLQFLL